MIASPINPLIDTHCHLDFRDFEGERDEIVARAVRTGVVRMVTICTRLETDRLATNQAIAETYPSVYWAAGVHPHEAGDFDGLTVDAVTDLGDRPKLVGIGETGLDYYYDHSPRLVQQACFRTHIRAARALGLPVIIHTRDAEDDTVAILEEEAARAAAYPLTGILHCFSGTQALADAGVRLGLHISLSGIVTFKKADALREVVRSVPIDRLLVETDAPYLAPVPRRGKRNEPAYVAHTAAAVADVKGVSVTELAARTTANALALFTRIPPPAAREAA